MAAQLFKFSNARGLTIKGVVYPARGAAEIGVIYLPGIVLGSTAVHRLGIDLAHRLADDGYPVCLFDPSGIGESEGDYPRGTHQELASWVESGSCVADTLEAIDQMRARTGVRRLVLIGHCGGALTAMYAAARHAAVAGALLICPPTVPQGRKEELDGAGVAESYLRQYLARLRSPDAWLRLLRGQSSYRTIVRVVRRKLERTLAAVWKPRRPAAAPAPAPVRAFNRHLVDAVQIAHDHGKRVEVVFGDRDPDVDDFRAFQRQHLPADVAWRIFEDTSHGFVTEPSMQLLFGEVGRFVSSVAA